jgi:hypothetical protein
MPPAPKATGQAESQSLPSSLWQEAALWVFSYKALYALVVLIIVFVFPDYDEAHFSSINHTWFGGYVSQYEKSNVARHFATWDAAHYLFISENGYCSGLRSCAFYPLWPRLSWAFSSVFHTDHLVSGLFLANALSAWAMTLFFCAAARRFGREIARWALISLLVFPGSLFFQFVYSESLFFFLLMVLWSALGRNQHWLVMISAFLLPLTRAIGLFCVLPIAWHYFSFIFDRFRKPAVSLSDCVNLKSPIPYIAVSAAPAGFAYYFFTMWLWTGNPFEGFHAQSFWGAHSIWNLFNVPKFLIGFFQPSVWHGFRGSLLDRYLFLMLILLVPKIAGLSKDLLLWVYVLAVIPAMSGTFASFVRFESVAFPVFLGLAVVLCRMRAPRRHYLLIAMAALQMFLLWRFLNFRWAG